MAKRKTKPPWDDLSPATQDFLQDFLKGVKDREYRTIDARAVESELRKRLETSQQVYLKPARQIAEDLGVSVRTVRYRRAFLRLLWSRPLLRFRTAAPRKEDIWNPHWNWKEFGPPRLAEHWLEALDPVLFDFLRAARGRRVYVPKKRKKRPMGGCKEKQKTGGCSGL